MQYYCEVTNKELIISLLISKFGECFPVMYLAPQTYTVIAKIVEVTIADLSGSEVHRSTELYLRVQPPPSLHAECQDLTLSTAPCTREAQ